MYVAVRGGLAIAVNKTGLAYAMGISTGAAVPDGFSVGLSVMGIADPPMRES